MQRAYEALTMPDDLDQTLVTYSAEPASEALLALRLLGSWRGDVHTRPVAVSGGFRP
jgi:hypothetical protein